MTTMKNTNPRLLPTENIETILVDGIGTAVRLRAVRKEYELRSDKTAELAATIG